MLNLPGRGRLGWHLAFHRPNIRHCGRIWYSGCTTARHAEYSTADTNRGLNLCWFGAQRDELKGQCIDEEDIGKTTQCINNPNVINCCVIPTSLKNNGQCRQWTRRENDLQIQ